jgi:hypothetical protein
MQLLRDVEARTAFLDHLHDAREVAVGAFQPFDDRWMAVMKMGFAHGRILCP